MTWTRFKMHFRRYYPRGTKYKYVLSDQQFEDLVKKNGLDYAMVRDNAYYEIQFDSIEEQKQMLIDCCDDIIQNTRFYLDNLDKIPEFKVNYRQVFPETIPKPKSL